MAKRWELQLRVFCICRRPAALRSKKFAAVLQHFYFLLEMMCHGARGVPARSVLHLQKARCLEGAGKAALELDAACPSLTRFQFHVYSNASCGSQFQSRADFSALTKSSEDFETAEALRLALPRAPSPRILHLKLSRVTSTQNFPSKTASYPSTQNLPAGTASRPFIHPYLKLSHASSLSSFTSVHTICYNTPVNNDTAHHVLP